MRTEASRPGPSPCSCTTSEKEGAAIACRVAELLPSEGTEAGALNERERLRASASTLIDEITHGGANLDHALGQTLSQLCMALREIDRAINEKHDSVYYKESFRTSGSTTRKLSAKRWSATIRHGRTSTSTMISRRRRCESIGSRPWSASFRPRSSTASRTARAERKGGI